jgi:hypothetical protein
MLNDELVGKAVGWYEWRGAMGEFEWTSRERLRRAGEYLVFWCTTGYWRIILEAASAATACSCTRRSS